MTANTWGLLRITCLAWPCFRLLRNFRVCPNKSKTAAVNRLKLYSRHLMGKCCCGIGRGMASPRERRRIGGTCATRRDYQLRVELRRIRSPPLLLQLNICNPSLHVPLTSNPPTSSSSKSYRLLILLFLLIRIYFLRYFSG